MGQGLVTRALTSREAVVRDWTNRWETAFQRSQVANSGRARELADEPVFSRKALAKHQGLAKHESSIVTQMRTGKIGLRAFLFSRQVPDVATPQCQCGQGRETAFHIAVACPDTEEARRQLYYTLGRQLLTSRDFAGATIDASRAKAPARWLQKVGRLQEFDLAASLGSRIEGRARQILCGHAESCRAERRTGHPRPDNRQN